MPEHPCHRHRPGRHLDDCLTGPCGFCGTDLRTITSGECRACLRIVCQECDGGYQPDLGPICRPCIPPPPGTSNASGGIDPDGCDLSDDQEPHRLCVFDLALSCGHLATVAVTGWYPVRVACCDRLGGTILRGDYVPYSSDVDYVNVLSERYEHRPKGTRYTPDRIIGRRPRTDEPYQSPYTGDISSAGRYPARVGATWHISGPVPPTTTR